MGDGHVAGEKRATRGPTSSASYMRGGCLNAAGMENRSTWGAKACLEGLCVYVLEDIAGRGSLCPLPELRAYTPLEPG
jgi:hypothetical protein